jgi:hypothetical protein
MPDETPRSGSIEFEQQFFKDEEKVSLKIEVLKETYQDIQVAIERNGWETEEGPRILLTLGPGYTQRQQFYFKDLFGKKKNNDSVQ